LQYLKDAQGSESLVTARGSPACSLREVNQDGTDQFIGNISLVRCFHGELMNTGSVDFEHADQNVAQNNQLDIGDPRIVWSIGGPSFDYDNAGRLADPQSNRIDYLASSHHRQGIMTDALNTLLHDWAIPRMGVRSILVAAFIGNDGSVKVFQRNGFKLVRTIEEFMMVKGKMRGVHVLEWNLSESL
jgi:RimJ/RimL family protein N-acetyltransferase